MLLSPVVIILLDTNLSTKSDIQANLLDFGKYVQEMLPKFVQQTQVTYG